MIPFSWRFERREASSASSPSRKALASQSLQMQKSPSLLASQVTSFLGVHDIFRVKKTEFLPLFTTLPQLPNLDLYIHLALCCCASSPSPSRSTSTLSSTSFCSSLHLSRAARRPDDAHLSSSVSFSASRRTESCICGGGFRCTYTPREMYPDGNRNSPSPFSKLASSDSASSSSSSAASSSSSAASSSSGSVSSPSLPPLREAVKALHPVPVGSFHAAAQALDQKFEGLLAAFSLEKSYFFCPSFFLCLPLQQVAARSSLVCGCAPSSRETGGGSASEQREAERRRRRNHAAGRQSASRQSASRQSASRGDREAKLCTERETQPTIGSTNGDTGEKANRGETPPREEEETQTDYESTEDETDDGDAADCSGEEGVSFHDFLACEEGEENEESSLRKEERRFVWNYELMKPFLVQGSPGLECLRRGILLPVLHGAVCSASLALSRGTARLLVIARRSAFFAGTRYRKRGLSVAGDAANEVETEFVFYTYTPRRASAFPPSSSSSYSRPLRVFDFHLFSHVQVRGSVPTFWAQEATVLPAMPAIACTQTDVNASATRRHFASLFQRYGAPVHVLNLLKRRLPSSPSAAASSFSPSSDSACSLSANWREESGEEPQSARVSRQSRKSPCSFSPSPLVEEGDPAAFLASSDSCLRATKSSPDLPSGRGSSSFALPVEAAPHNGSSTVSSARYVDTPQPPGSSETSVSPVFASPVVSSLLRASSAELPRLSLASCASSSSASPPYASSSFSSSSSLHAAVGAAFAAGRKGAGYERREEQEGELSEVYRQLVDAMNEELPPSLRINFHWIDLKRQQYRRPIPHATPSASFPSAPPSACGEAFALEGRGAPACRLRWRAAKNVGMFSFPAQRLGRTASWHTGTPFAPCSDEWRQSFFDSREGDEQRAKAEERERERERDREEEETLTPYQQLQRLGDELMNTVGVFYTNDPITLAATSVQRGICRVNCLDCLDRTNDAQLVLYKNVLLHLLRVMRFIPADSLDLDPQVASVLSSLLEAAGDQIAMQYGGSCAHKKEQLLNTRTPSSASRHPSPSRLPPRGGPGPGALVSASSVPATPPAHGAPLASAYIRINPQREGAEPHGFAAWMDSAARALRGWRRSRSGEREREQRDEDHGTSSPLFFLSLATSVKRRYNNILADGSKQQAVNLVQCKVQSFDFGENFLASLEVDSDACLHHEWTEPSFEPREWWVLPLQRFFNAIRLATSFKTLLLSAPSSSLVLSFSSLALSPLSLSPSPAPSFSLSASPGCSALSLDSGSSSSSLAQARWVSAALKGKLELPAFRPSPWFALFGGSLRPPAELRFPRCSSLLHPADSPASPSCFPAWFADAADTTKLRVSPPASSRGTRNRLECVYTYEPWRAEAEEAGAFAAEVARALLKSPVSLAGASESLSADARTDGELARCNGAAEGGRAARHLMPREEGSESETATHDEEGEAWHEDDVSVEVSNGEEGEAEATRQTRRRHGKRGDSDSLRNRWAASRRPDHCQWVSPFHASFCLLLPGLFLRVSESGDFTDRRTAFQSVGCDAGTPRGRDFVTLFSEMDRQGGSSEAKCVAVAALPRPPRQSPSLSSLPSFPFSFSAFPSLSSVPSLQSFSPPSAAYLALQDVADDESAQGERVLLARFLELNIGVHTDGDPREEAEEEGQEREEVDEETRGSGTFARPRVPHRLCCGIKRNVSRRSVQQPSRARGEPSISVKQRRQQTTWKTQTPEFRRRTREARAVHFLIGDTPSLGGFSLASHPASSLLAPSRPPPFSSLQIFQGYQASLLCDACRHAQSCQNDKDRNEAAGREDAAAGVSGRSARLVPFASRACGCVRGSRRDCCEPASIRPLKLDSLRHVTSRYPSPVDPCVESSFSSSSASPPDLQASPSGLVRQACVSPFCLRHWEMSPTQALVVFAEARRRMLSNKRELHAPAGRERTPDGERKTEAPGKKRGDEEGRQERPQERETAERLGSGNTERQPTLREREESSDAGADWEEGATPNERRLHPRRAREAKRELEKAKNGDVAWRRKEQPTVAREARAERGVHEKGDMRHPRPRRTSHFGAQTHVGSSLFLPSGCQVKRGTSVFTSGDSCSVSLSASRISHFDAAEGETKSFSRLVLPLSEALWARSSSLPTRPASAHSEAVASLARLWRREASPGREPEDSAAIGDFLSPVQWPLFFPEDMPSGTALESSFSSSAEVMRKSPKAEREHRGGQLLPVGEESRATSQYIPLLFGEAMAKKKQEVASLLQRAENAFTLVHGW
ncbi:SacI homology domain-containing protein [Toxoplasma gondii p89]|uniref:SacI homology domain-containing protein n=1 Tax=Toxoplasma gondii p89 TaxID=943119 RepID=A0A086L1D8_TOXGO|nr:SacI homology domain-containing protein [Toxoplasma gondii p89]